MRRRWIILWVTLALIACTLIIGLIIHELSYREPPKDEACRSSHCINTAAQIWDFIDTTTDPCDNFYKFACGNFIKTVEIPDEADEISTLSIINENLQKKLREVLEEPINEEEIRTFRILKTYYKSCINTEGVARRGMDVVNNILQEIGGWPVLVDHRKWDSQSLDWYIYIYKLRKLGANTDHIIKLDVDNDMHNSTFYKLKIDKPIFTLPKEFLINEVENEYVEEYRRFMINAAVYLGADHYRAVRELSKALEFESKLAMMTMTEEDNLNSSFSGVIMSIRDIEENYPSIPWYEYVSALVEPNVPITRSENVIIASTEYLEKLEELLAVTPKRDLINYLVWKVVESLTPYLTNNFRKFEYKFQTGLHGNVQDIPRWKECVQEVYKSLPVALSAKYVRSQIKNEDMEQVKEIATGIKDEFIRRFKKKQWKNRSQKFSNLEKIATLTSVIGFPEELFLDDVLNEFHKDVEVNTEDYLLSYLNITRTMQDLKFKNLRRVTNKIAWIQNGAIAEVHSSYEHSSNTIKIPAGVFQGTVFNKNLPKYMNYAGVGFLIAREIGQAAFYDRHDSDDCFIGQFNNFTVELINETVDGLATLRNNIADAVGLRYSYATYLAWLKKVGTAEDRLSGLEYSPEQLFWITFAINQCSNIRPEHLKLWMAQHSIAPPDFRVIGAIQNVPSFSFDFDCHRESLMSYNDHCPVW